MKASELEKLLRTSIPAKQRVLIKGEPGIGKSDIVAKVCKEVGADLIIQHPAVSDPTDFKGMPALAKGGAEFLPFGDLRRLIDADKLTVCFQDDIGQAAPSVQAALMQLNQARQVNGHKISDHVVFLGATNDTKHAAGVSGMIEPLKSRWDAIVELNVNLDDWIDWAIAHDVSSEIVAFIRFRPSLLSDFKPTKELTNSPSPRTWAAVARWFKLGVTSLEVMEGAIGKGAASEFAAFLGLLKKCPDLDDIIAHPEKIGRASCRERVSSPV